MKKKIRLLKKRVFDVENRLPSVEKNCLDILSTYYDLFINKCGVDKNDELQIIVNQFIINKDVIYFIVHNSLIIKQKDHI